MGKMLITVPSITVAIKGRDLLRNNGVQAYIDKSPDAPDRLGCGYSVTVPHRGIDALRILQAAGIRVVSTRVKEM